MLLALIRKEILSHVLTLRFGVTFALFILLVFASTYVTTNQYRSDADEAMAGNRAARVELEQVYARAENAEDKFWAVFYDAGQKESVPPPPLSSVAQGLRPVMPAMVQTRAWGSQMIGRGGGVNPLTRLLPAPDLVYVVSVVLSLLAILFAFDSICGEKESGTLRLMMSNSVPRDQVLLAKWLGGYLMLVAPFLIAVFGGAVYAWWAGALAATGENLSRLGLLLGIACLYISVFFTLSLAISALTHRSSTALFTCLLVWVVWILVIPNLAPVLAKIMEPGYAPLKIAQEKDAVHREYELRIQRLALTSGKLTYGTELAAEGKKLEAERDRHLQQWDRFQEDSNRRQQELAGVLGRVSPSACWTYAAVELTDVGPSSYKRFLGAAEKLQKEMRATADGLRDHDSDEDARPFTLDQVPRLRQASESFPRAAGRTVNDILILAVLNVVFFMTAFIRFLRYDVR